ncbi:uncharacterized protein LOC116197449 isoform X2 [Punica granatum]|uniref:Uncharacterized protein LOC116197449 isoform X2 n=1 Tax=Punica granatum TaxID=22663 RepID=A0A6P8CQ68_PUNGR|nr:uncharacterized protein LOC116197449 isoform X2 [Punica granatum]
MKLRAFSAALSPPAAAAQARRSFRSDAALEAIARASGDRVPNVALYNYPSFSGAFSALFARLFHDRLGLPCLILPFSSVEPLRVEDLYTEGIERCYLLDLLGPREFLATLAQRSSCKIIAFDHRKCMLSRVPPRKAYPENVSIYINTEKSSSFSVYEYFSAKLMEAQSPNDGAVASLFEPKDRDRVETVLKYIEDGDLRRWSLTDIRAFNIGSSEWRSKLNCVTNPYMYEQLLEISFSDLIAKGSSYISSRKNAAAKFLDKVFKGVRADGSSDLSDEIGKQLSLKSAASGLRPIGAVIYMQRNNLKMCLRSIDDTTDTSEVAKAYGGGGTPRSSSFIIKMDEYNCWLSGN